MNDINTIFLFVFIFSVITVLRTVFMFIVSLLQDTPQKMVLSNRELIFLAISISYCLTYIIKL
jgi:hypothetical protein